MPFIPRERPAGNQAAQAVQKEVVAERDPAIQDAESERRTGKPFERLAREMPETGGGQVVAMRRVGEGIVRAEVRSDDVNLRLRLGDAVDLAHDSHQVVEVLENVRKINSGGGIVPEGPGKAVQVADHIRRGVERLIESQGTGFDLVFSAANVDRQGFAPARKMGHYVIIPKGAGRAWMR